MVRNLMRLPLLRLIIVVVTFVTMAIGVNARTAFSLFYPPIIDEFGWERGVTAGAFSFGFLVSGAVSPLIGADDRAGPRAVMERRRSDGGRAVAGAADHAAMAPVSDDQRHGRGRKSVSAAPVNRCPAQLVYSAARPGHGPASPALELARLHYCPGCSS
jgi:hypothetical protein